MPLLEHWDVEVEVTVRVLNRRRPSHPDRTVLAFTTSGKSSGDSATGLPSAMHAALTEALRDGDTIADNFRKGSRDAR